MIEAQTPREASRRPGLALCAALACALVPTDAAAQTSLALEVDSACRARRSEAGEARETREAREAGEGDLVVRVVATKAGLGVADRHVRVGVAERGAYGDAAAPSWVRDAWTDAAGRAVFGAPPEGRVLAYVVSDGARLVVADALHHPLEPAAFGGAPLPWTVLEVRDTGDGPARAQLFVAEGSAADGTVRRAGGLPWGDAPAAIAWIAAPGSLQLCAPGGDGAFAWRDPRPAPDDSFVDDPAAPSPPLLERVRAGTRPTTGEPGEPAPGHVHGVPAPVRGAPVRLEVHLRAQPPRTDGGANEVAAPSGRALELPRASTPHAPSRDEGERFARARRLLLASLEADRAALGSAAMGVDAAQADVVLALRRRLRAQLLGASDPAEAEPYPELADATARRRAALRESLPDADRHRFGVEPREVARALAHLDADDAPTRARARRALQRWIDAIAPFEPGYAAALAARHVELVRPSRLRRRRGAPRPLDPIAARVVADEVAAAVLADLARAERTEEPWALPVVALAHLDPAALEQFVRDVRALDPQAGAVLAIVGAAALVVEARARDLDAPRRWEHLDLRGLGLGMPERTARDPRSRDWGERLTR